MSDLFAIDGKIHRDEPLSRHSSFKIGGNALYFAEPTSREELTYLLDFAERRDLPKIIIGKASNILFADEGYEGLVISLTNFETGNMSVQGPSARVSAGAGMPAFARFLAEHGLGGLEFVSTIPGTVGGGLVMNAGYSRHAGRLNQLADWVTEVKVLDQSGAIKTLRREDISFRYRSSSLAGRVVVEATFRLNLVPREDAWQELKANLAYREGVQPLQYPSAGSVFKNPAGAEFSAGRMIDMAGLRGLRVGDAQISEKHGNFIINTGRARAKDVLELIAIAKDKVKERFGVGLELEVKYIPSETLPLAV